MKGCQSRLQRLRSVRRSLPVCLERESQTEEQNFVQISRFSCLAFSLSLSSSSSSSSSADEDGEAGGKRVPGFKERIFMAWALV